MLPRAGGDRQGMLLSDKPLPARTAFQVWERRNRRKSLWGNVSLLRGCQRHRCVAIPIVCQMFQDLYIAAIHFFVTGAGLCQILRNYRIVLV